jgi:lysophospholipase L1-like esterase
MNQPLTLAVIGDSAASGVGDSDTNGNHFGWGYHLAQAFNEPLVYINAARPGARSREVLEEQLIKVSVHDPELVAVVVGGNDLLRSNFSPTIFERNLRETMIRLVSSGATVMLLELHDPTKIVPMPYLVGRICRRRVAAVNAATGKIAQDFGAILLPTRSLENIYARSKWHVDRMHPSKLGHQFIASEFAKLLRNRGFDVGDVMISETNNRSRKDSILWMLRNGTPWFAKRSVDLLPGLIWLSLAEIIFIVKAKYPQIFSQITHLQGKITQCFQQIREHLAPRSPMAEPTLLSGQTPPMPSNSVSSMRSMAS